MDARVSRGQVLALPLNVQLVELTTTIGWCAARLTFGKRWAYA